MRAFLTILSVLAALSQAIIYTEPVLYQAVVDNSTSYKGQFVQPNAFFEPYTSHWNCPNLGRGPGRPQPLTFCNFYNDKSCCNPDMDAEILSDYQQLTMLGTSCRIRSELRSQPFARIYCLSCNPDTPMYTRNEVYNPLRQNCPTSSRTQTLLICKDWALSAFMMNVPLDIYDDCGLDRSTGCFDSNGARINGRNRYVCGDDKLIPSSVFNMDDNGNPVSAQVAIESFLNYDDMQAPNLDSQFGFKLVSSQQCTDAQAALSNPDCLRTQAQVMTYLGQNATSQARCANADNTVTNAAFCAPVHAEFCYAGSSATMTNITNWLFVLCSVIVAALMM